MSTISATMFLLLLLSFLASEMLKHAVADANGCGGVTGQYVCNSLNPSRFDICIGDHKYTMSCPGGLHFDSRTQICDWPRNADCGKAGAARPPPPVNQGYRAQSLDNYVEAPSSYLGGDGQGRDVSASGRHQSDSVTVKPVAVRNGDRRTRQGDGHDLRASHAADSGFQRPSHASNHLDRAENNIHQANEMHANGNSLRTTLDGRASRNQVTARERPGARQNPYVYRGGQEKTRRENTRHSRYQDVQARDSRRADDGYNRYRTHASKKTQNLQLASKMVGRKRPSRKH